MKLSSQRLLHVEYIRTPEPDMFVRMLNYRGRIMREHKDMSLTQALIHLAAIGLDATTIDLIRKEIGMSIEEVVAFYDQTEIGQELREQGREQGTVRTLTTVLRARFDTDSRIPQIASDLAHLPDQTAAISAATLAQTLDELAQLIESSNP